MIVNTISLKDSNQTAETKALWLLRQQGFQFIQQLDWIGEKDGEWAIFEIKEKELFTPGSNYPHYGAGLNKSQLYLRTQLRQKLGWRTYLLNFVPGTDDVYGAYLDELEAKGGFYDTQNKIRVYPLEHFKKIITAADLPFKKILTANDPLYGEASDWSLN